MIGAPDDKHNIFFINMAKDIGRMMIIDKYVKLLGATIWTGLDPTECDLNGYITKWADNSMGTYMAKQTKLRLFEHFLKTNKSQYLVLFEDDIVFRHNFIDSLDQINLFLNDKSPMLLYFGVSGNYKSMNHNNDIIIKPLFDDNRKEPYPGAYSVCIHRSILQSLIYRINDDLIKYKPFDIYCLGKMQQVYKHACYITDPPLCIPDIENSNIRTNRNSDIVWDVFGVNKLDYDMFAHINAYISLDNTHLKTLLLINKQISCLAPIVRPIYCFPNNDVITMFTDKYGSLGFYRFELINDHKNMLTPADINIKYRDVTSWMSLFSLLSTTNI